jgi:hypothetical protein
MISKTTSHRYARSNSVLVLTVLFGLVCSVPLQAQSVKWTNNAGDNAWNNPRNWDPQGVPKDQKYTVVGLSGKDRAIVNQRPDKSDFHLNVSGELDVRAPFAPDRRNRYVDLRPGGGVMNVWTFRLSCG